jgi:hypothetical protein
MKRALVALVIAGYRLCAAARESGLCSANVKLATPSWSC